MIPEFLKKLTPYETEEEERIGEERKRSATKKAKVGCDESSEAKERLTEEVDTSDLLSDLKKNSDKGSESNSEEEEKGEREVQLDVRNRDLEKAKGREELTDPSSRTTPCRWSLRAGSQRVA